MADSASVNETAGAPPAGPQASGYSWYVLFVLVVVYILNFIDRQIISILAVDIKADLGLTDGDMGFLGGAAFAVFAVFAGLFALGAMGGGDVKMIGAVMLWIPLYLYFPMLTIMAIGGGILSAVMLVQSKIRPSDKVIEVPYGVAIAIAGLWALHQQYLNHFQSIA